MNIQNNVNSMIVGNSSHNFNILRCDMWKHELLCSVRHLIEPYRICPQIVFNINLAISNHYSLVATNCLFTFLCIYVHTGVFVCICVTKMMVVVLEYSRECNRGYGQMLGIFLSHTPTQLSEARFLTGLYRTV